MMRLIIYDLDGTLADTRKDISLAANHMLRTFGAPEVSEEEVAGYVGRGVFELVKRCLRSEDEKKIEKGIKVYRKYYGEHLLDHTCLYPGARNLLDYFRTRKQAVVTNKPGSFSKDILAGLGVGDYFTEVIGGDSKFPKKPDPAAVAALMKKEKTLPDQTLFIGDSCVDIETSRRAGINVAIVSHGFDGEEALNSASPEVMAKNFSELLVKIKDRKW